MGAAVGGASIWPRCRMSLTIAWWFSPLPRGVPAGPFLFWARLGLRQKSEGAPGWKPRRPLQDVRFRFVRDPNADQASVLSLTNGCAPRFGRDAGETELVSSWLFPWLRIARGAFLFSRVYRQR
jgi:hypothetical protein